MKIQRLRYRIPSRVPYQITTLLRCLGLACQPWKGNNRDGFWQRYTVDQLHVILYEAKQQYRKYVRKLHPDKQGHEEKCKVVNMIWQRITMLFQRKGIQL